ncbi:hypothetical protein EB75_27765 [Mycobacterium sp. ST-F2]|uniref:acyltransferase n=1 Tax=Mycobacterium sp. ST-F2 TaxID=1490484 RepID=UPI00093E9593|nr:hypothetical protein [Mycobacterium sp. ST-F2]OKH78345.1 hypothetical protein EB75_27765 [Mycobacterium sp. ST-F2]
MTVTPGNEHPESAEDSTADVHPTKISRTWFPTNKWEQLGERLYNVFVTNFPSNAVRVATLRIFGAEIGADTRIELGVRVLGIQQLHIGAGCVIGTRSLVDARGEIVIADNVIVERDVQLISGQHVVNSDDFSQLDAPIYIDEGALVEFRSMIVQGVQVCTGAVVAPCSLVREDVAPMTVVAGIPAVRTGERKLTA